MASARISTPMRGVTLQLSKLSIRREASTAGASTSFARTISTSPSSHASVSSITTSVDAPIPVIPLAERTVTATLHHFPSLEPLGFHNYPANHLDLPTRKDILHRAVIFEGDSARSGTASAKWRSEVHGSRRKVRPQKGSGRARLGDKKSPMLRGGGKAHGPGPRDFSTGLQRKVYDIAWRTALSYRFRKGELIIVDNALELETPSTSLLRWVFDRNKWGQRYGRTILVTLQDRPLLAKAMADTPKEGWTAPWDEVDVKDMLTLGRVVIERPALKNILLSHQNDLVTTKFPPKLSKRLEPVELQAALGWSEFRQLESMAAEEEQPEELKASLFERVGNRRLEQAAALPSDQAIELQVSAYELLSEARRIQGELLESHPDLEYEDDLDDALRVKAVMKRIEILKLNQQMCQYNADKCLVQKDTEGAERWEEDLQEEQEQAEMLQQEVDELLGINETSERSSETPS